MLIYDIKPPEKTITLEATDTTNSGEYIFNPPVQRIIDLRCKNKDLKSIINGYNRLTKNSQLIIRA